MGLRLKDLVFVLDALEKRGLKPTRMVRLNPPFRVQGTKMTYDNLFRWMEASPVQDVTALLFCNSISFSDEGVHLPVM